MMTSLKMLLTLLLIQDQLDSKVNQLESKANQLESKANQLEVQTQPLKDDHHLLRANINKLLLIERDQEITVLGLMTNVFSL